MKEKKTFISFISVILLVFLAACSASTNSTPSTSDKSNSNTSDKTEEKIELRFAYWAGGNRTILYNKIIENFEKKHPNIKIKKEIADFGPYWDKIATQTAASNPPDVFQQHLTKVVEYAKRGQLRPLNDFEQQGIIDLSKFNSRIVDSGRYGKDIVMVTMGNSISGALYNEDIFKKAGVEPPGWNWTWKEYEEKAIKLATAVHRDDFWGFEDQGGHAITFGDFVRQRGRDFYNTNRQLGFTKQDMIDYLSMFDRMRKAKAAPPAEVSVEYATDNKERHVFPLGMVALTMKPSNHLGAYQGYMKDKASITREPNQGGDEGGLTYSGAYMSVSPYTKHAKEAAIFINYWVNDLEAGEQFLLEQGVPGSSAVVERITPLLKEPEQKIAKYVSKASSYAADPIQAPAGSSDVDTFFKKSNDYVAFGQKTVQKAVDDFFNDASRILK